MQLLSGQSTGLHLPTAWSVAQHMTKVSHAPLHAPCMINMIIIITSLATQCMLDTNLLAPLAPLAY